MKIGVLSDIHGNYIALQQSLDFLKRSGVDEVFFLGDAVGYMPKANEVIETLRTENIKCLSGNHEAMLLGWLPTDPKSEEVYQIDKIRTSLSDSNLSFIKGLLPFREMVIGNSKFLMVHGSPVDPLNGCVYPDTDLGNLEILSSYDFILMGHTHRPFVKRVNDSWFVNVGSCGMPRDAGDLASLAVINTEKKEPEIIRIPMDIKAMTLQYKNWVHPDVANLWNRKASENISGKIIS